MRKQQIQSLQRLVKGQRDDYQAIEPSTSQVMSLTDAPLIKSKPFLSRDISVASGILVPKGTMKIHTHAPSLYQRCIAEMTGTFVLVIFGLGPSMNEALANGRVANSVTAAFGWLFGVMGGVCIAEGVSGAHLNPAITLANFANYKLKYVENKFTLKEVLCYSMAQTMGAFLAAAILLSLFYHQFNGDWNHRTSLVFVTAPSTHTSVAQAFFNEVVSVAIMLVGIFAIVEPINGIAHSTAAKAVIIGAYVYAVVVTFNGVCGPSLNPARDLGPRILCAFAGWRSSVFTYKRGFFLVPIIGPLFGGLVGTCFYHQFIRPAFHYEKFYTDTAKRRHLLYKKYMEMVGTTPTSPQPEAKDDLFNLSFA